MNDLNGIGIVAGVIAWVCIMWYAVTQSACLRASSCGGGDLFIFAAIGVGMLAPAWVVAVLISVMFKK